MRIGISIILAITLATVCSVGATNAIAEEKQAGSGPNPFTDCGIGAALFPNTHWAAVTSNVIWDVGTTAVISATASPETCQGVATQAASFINETYDNVLEDTARGDGEYIVALLQIYGCAADAQDEILDSIRDDIGAVIARDDYATMPTVKRAESYFKVIDTEIRNDFATSCSA